MPSFEPSLSRRTVLGGAAGLGLAAVTRSVLVHAQATPEASDDPSTTEDTRLARAAERYDEFVSGLAGALDIADTATVDAAIRTSLTAMIDAQLAAGEISANDAEAARTAIASAPSPVAGLLMAGRGDRAGFGGDGWGGLGRRPSHQSTDDTDADGSPEPSASPSAI
jgi:hypothetical protein